MTGKLPTINYIILVDLLIANYSTILCKKSLLFLLLYGGAIRF